MRGTARLQLTIVVGCLVVAVGSGLLAACGTGEVVETSPVRRLQPPAERAAATPDGADGAVEDYEATAADFTNLQDMTPVRGFFVDNRLGYLDEAIAVAESPDGGVYPVGTIIQLVPQEAMVKRRAGWSPATRDWEFFFLDVTPEGTIIVDRGADQVVNRFGGNCAECHQAAEPRFDLVCEQDHGCDPLPIDRSVIEAIQAADPRPLLAP